MSSRKLARASILRSAPNSDLIRPLAADDRVFPTGRQDGDWLEALDSDENIVWMQGDRFTVEH